MEPSTHPFLKIVGITVGGLLVVIEGCSYLSERAYKADEPRRKAEENARALEVERTINEALWAMGGSKAAGLLSDCAAMVRAKADELKPFSGFVVESHSADIYQVAAANITMRPMSERTKELVTLVNNRDPGAKMGFESLSRFTVIEPKDTFDGPKKFAFTYTCHLNKDLSLSVWKVPA